MLALSFARSVATMSFALRFSVLPLIDSIMYLAFEYGLEISSYRSRLTSEHEFEIRRSAINLQRFTLTGFFESELRGVTQPKSRTRKAPDS